MAPRWRYLLAEVGLGLKRNLLMTLATVVTVTVSLALLGVGMLIRSQVDLARSLLYQEVEVSIFLLDSVTEEQRADFEQELVNNPEVESVLYESKQEAYERAKQIFAGEEALLETLQPEDLPASFRVSLNNPENFDIVRSQYVEYPGVEDVVDRLERDAQSFAIPFERFARSCIQPVRASAGEHRPPKQRRRLAANDAQVRVAIQIDFAAIFELNRFGGDHLVDDLEQPVENVRHGSAPNAAKGIDEQVVAREDRRGVAQVQAAGAERRGLFARHAVGDDLAARPDAVDRGCEQRSADRLQDQIERVAVAVESDLDVVDIDESVGAVRRADDRGRVGTGEPRELQSEPADAAGRACHRHTTAEQQAATREGVVGGHRRDW